MRGAVGGKLMIRRHTILTPEEIWRRCDADERRLTAPLSEAMLDLAEIRPGMQVPDLATGRREPHESMAALTGYLNSKGLLS